MKRRIEILSHEKREARATMLLPLGAISPERSGEGAPSLAGPQTVLLDNTGRTLQSGGADGFANLDDLRPSESDYIYPVFRALSAAVIPGYWLDYTTPGVLESSVQQLAGQTVYKNHNFTDVEGWLGVVNAAVWDAAGDQTGGVPGINVEMKIDWRMNPKIARGLLMHPPAIHSASVTILFEYEYSHPDLMDQKRFWDLLGEDVDGQTVRLIVTKILGYWEISLVFQGADQFARQIRATASQQQSGSQSEPVPEQDEPHTPQQPPLSTSALAALGFAGKDEKDTERISAEVLRLKQSANTGELLLAKARAEAVRLARLAHLDDATEDASIAELINTAGPDQLESITRLYQEKAARRFPHTCRKCGTPAHFSRSSVEFVPDEIDTRHAPADALRLH